MNRAHVLIHEVGYPVATLTLVSKTKAQWWKPVTHALSEDKRYLTECGRAVPILHRFSPPQVGIPSCFKCREFIRKRMTDAASLPP